MTRLPRLFLPIVIIVACVLTAACLTGSQRAFAKTASESGSVKSLCIEQAAAGKTIVLRGRDARQQLCVTGILKGGTARDLTHSGYVRRPPVDFLVGRAWRFPRRSPGDRNSHDLRTVPFNALDRGHLVGGYAKGSGGGLSRRALFASGATDCAKFRRSRTPRYL